jgi:hypothetical protein
MPSPSGKKLQKHDTRHQFDGLWPRARDGGSTAGSDRARGVRALPVDLIKMLLLKEMTGAAR